jgi:hypothetical protein
MADNDEFDLSTCPCVVEGRLDPIALAHAIAKNVYKWGGDNDACSALLFNGTVRAAALLCRDGFPPKHTDDIIAALLKLFIETLTEDNPFAIKVLKLEVETSDKPIARH